MFEEDLETLRDHIEYLKGILEIDWSESDDFDEMKLRSRLNDCEDDIKNIEFDMPYDEIDEDDIPIEDMSGENLEEGELEDEIVEVEAAIKELRELMEIAQERYIDGDYEGCLDNITIQVNHEFTEDAFKKRLLQWVREEIVKKISKSGPYLKNEDIDRLAYSIILDAKCRAYHDKTEALAEEKYPELQLKEEEICKNHLFSCGLNHISMGLIIQYECLGKMMDFDTTLNFQKSIWGNLI